MFRIIQNAWIDEVRSRVRHDRIFAPEEEGEHVGVCTTDAQIDAIAVRKAVAQLGEDQRSVVGLVLVEGLPYKEAAQVLDIPIGTLTSRLARAREALAGDPLNDAGAAMMLISDDILMAYADGELDEPSRSEVERAIAGDAALAESVRLQAAMRERVKAAYRPVVDEPVPERLLQSVRQTPGAAPASPLLSLAQMRAGKDAKRASAWAQSWARWGGVAASVLLGVVIGKLIPTVGDAPSFETRAGRLVALGAVSQALSTQLASAPVRNGVVAVQLSFIDRSGSYCRTFTTVGLAGLACRDGPDWTVQVLARVDAGPSTGMRQAATALPPAILSEVDQRIRGGALDAKGEQAAMSQGWRRSGWWNSGARFGRIRSAQHRHVGRRRPTRTSPQCCSGQRPLQIVVHHATRLSSQGTEAVLDRHTPIAPSRGPVPIRSVVA